MMECPYCAAAVSTGENCPACQRETPAAFATTDGAPSMIRIATAGYPNHGKSELIRAQLLCLNHMGGMVPGLWYKPLDNFTQDRLQQIQRRQELHRTEDSSSMEPELPWLLQVEGLPVEISGPQRNALLAIHDLGGELFESPQEMEGLLNFIASVDCFFVVVSPTMLEQEGVAGSLVDILRQLDAYAVGAGGSLKGKKVVFTVSKADDIDGLPDSVERYMRDDPLCNVPQAGRPSNLDMGEYLSQLLSIAPDVRALLERKVPAAQTAFSMAEGLGLELKFSVTSATGHSLENGQDVMNRTWLRVLDPLFLATMQHRRPTTKRQKFSVIVDSALRQEECIEAWAGIRAMVEKMGSVRNFAMGSRRPLRGSSMSIPAAGASPHRFIGPILDADPSGWAVVVTNRDPADLSDFLSSSWRNRLLIASVDDCYEGIWPHWCDLGSGLDSVEELLNELIFDQED